MLSERILQLQRDNPASLQPRCLELLQDILRDYKPKVIVEFGSGVSTLLLAEYSKENECQIYSVDDSKEYLEKTKEMIGEYPTGRIELMLSPRDYKEFLKRNIEADLVIIDGPSTKRFKRDMRKFLAKAVGHCTVVIVDDTDRKRENSGAYWLAFKNKMDRKVDYYVILPEEGTVPHQFSILYPRCSKATEN